MSKIIGFAVTGSFCTFEKIKIVIKQLSKGPNRVIPIFSFMAQTTDCRFGKAEDFVKEVQEITGEKGIFTIPEAEPIGPKAMLDVLVIAPCTGNTLAKLAMGITDSAVLMAAKAHLRNDKPLVIGVSTNDGLGANFQNVGILMNRKNVFFVPFGQDDYEKKPNSLVAHWDKVEETMELAEKKRQIQPVLLSPFDL
ncbi:MAG: dipicolinate synthase subunit B [Eubacterium sp.]|nr:dipicolinate synthase subunit B [Eubacterium sp.]